MNDFTGRRHTNRARNIGKGILEGLGALGTAMADAPKKVRINEIDTLVENLLQERDHLIADLIEPGDLKVSENYDPRWRKPSVVGVDEAGPLGDRPVVAEGRLTECAGSWRDNDPFDKSHPGCPYRKTQHVKHEFTLRD